MKKIYIQITITLLFLTSINAQNPNFTWAKGMGSTGNDVGNSVAVDASGNVYSVGYFTGTSDFDPGPGTFTMSSSGSSDIFISKFDINGNFVWAKQIGGTANDQGLSIALDASNNVYTTGYFGGTVDFDPGAGTFNMISAGGSSDIFISKLDVNGNFVWAKQIGSSPNADWGQSVKIDGLGNVVTVGYFFDTPDFDPGAGTFNMTSAGSEDVFISKLDASGNFVWAKQLGGVGQDRGFATTIDASGSIYTTGLYTGIGDFDPGAGTFNMTPVGGNDIFVSKLDASGNFVWAKSMGGPNGDAAQSITLDQSNNVYTTGNFSTTADFDPGAGVFNLTSAGLLDIFISKLNSVGNFVWAKRIGGSTQDNANSITIDVSGNVFTTGGFNGIADFDPGLATYNLTPFGAGDAFISKLDANGNFVWAGQLGGASSTNNGNEIVSDVLGSIYTTGTYFSTTDFDASPSTSTITSTGGGDIFVTKYCQIPSQPSSINGNLIICSGSINTYTIATVPGASSYTWSLPGGWSGVSSTISINPTAGGASGNITVTANNACGTSVAQTLSVTVNSSPTITVNSGTICSGQSFTMAPGGANSYTFSSGPVVSPTITSTYSVTGTSTNGCVSNSAVISNITVSALPIITVNSGSICSGSSFTIIPGGANTYTIQGGSAVVSPTITSSYTVTGTSTAGCVSASPATSNVTVYTTPTISVNSGAICSGQSFTMSPSGANTYTFSSGPVVTPTANTTYSVTGISAQGCISASSAVSSVTVNALPTIGATTSNTFICTGQSATLTASGASTYTFNPGGAGTSIAVSPTITATYTITGTDSNGCTNSTAFTQSVSTCAGVSAIASAKEDISIFPNPFTSNVTIKGAEGKTISVYNALGVLIHTELPTANCELDLTTQPNGIYFIRVGNITQKIVKN